MCVIYKMKLLELFSGTKSVGKVAEQLGYEVVSLDLKNADINCNIIDWDYFKYEPKTFDVIWASPPCNTFSMFKKKTTLGNTDAQKKVYSQILIILDCRYYEKQKKSSTSSNQRYILLKIHKQENERLYK